MELYAHQLKVYDWLSRGKSVLLRAPTGSGKTQASLYPYLAAMDRQSDMHHHLPHKCIYSVPMRVLAKQFFVEYKRTVNRYNQRYATEIDTSIQTGDMPQDPELERNLIFATIDQTLSSFLMAPYGLSRGRANLNLGAILSSYLVFDEFHLYDPDSTLPTTLQMLRMLRGITPFVLMTATFSDELVNRLACKLDAEVVGISAEDRVAFETLSSQAKTRRYHASDEMLTPEIVLDKHTGRSIVICNTVKRARTMANRLRAQSGDTDVILLHSQFLREDRDRIEAHIRERFDKKATPDGSYIIVSTQAIEVGVDITSTVMHTELAPANSVIQRAGRCARYPGNVGDVYVYRHVWDQDGEAVDLCDKPAPYMGKWQKSQMSTTFEAFQAVSGDALRYDDEQHIIDHVHAEADAHILNGLNADSAGHRASMFAAMRGEADQVGELVRKVIAQPVTIHDAPESLEEPYKYPAFSLHPGSLRGYATNWLDRFHALDDDDVPPFSIKYLHSETDPDDSTKTVDRWILVREKVSEIPYGTLVVVHPALANYTPQDGFTPESGGGWEVPPQTNADKNKQRSKYVYRLETYTEHIRLVHKATFGTDKDIGHAPYWDELTWAAHRLAERLEVTFEEIKQAAELTIWLHDVGKLSTGWQDWVREYQARIGMPVDAGEAYAHTELQTDDHRAIEKAMRKRPPHAVESAVAVIPLLRELPKSLRQAVFTAISRHHGAFTENHTSVQLARFAEEKAGEAMKSSPLPLLRGTFPKSANVFSVIKEQHITEFFVYAILVRLLRRADVRGTTWGSSP